MLYTATAQSVAIIADVKSFKSWRLPHFWRCLRFEARKRGQQEDLLFEGQQSDFYWATIQQPVFANKGIMMSIKYFKERGIKNVKKT